MWLSSIPESISALWLTKQAQVETPAPSVCQEGKTLERPHQLPNTTLGRVDISNAYEQVLIVITGPTGGNGGMTGGAQFIFPFEVGTEE